MIYIAFIILGIMNLSIILYVNLYIKCQRSPNTKHKEVRELWIEVPHPFWYYAPPKIVALVEYMRNIFT